MKKLALVIGCLFSSYVTADADHAMDLYLNQDYVAAFSAFSKTAELGHAKSQFNLGVQYLRGQGVKADLVKAYSYLTLSLENGFKMARQAQKTVMRKLTPAELKQAQLAAKSLIALYGPNGSQHLTQALAFNQNYNPPPVRTQNPVAKYPSKMFSDGVPGLARYVFDIDRNGKVRDLQLLQAYPSADFARSVEQKLRDSRYQILKINGTLRKFAHAQFSGVFKRTDIPTQTLEKLNQKKAQLLAQAKSGSVAAQAELADLLTLTTPFPSDEFAVFDKQTVSAGVAPRIKLTTDAPDFAYHSEYGQSHYNLHYFVWFDEKGNVTKQQAHNAHQDVPTELSQLTKAHLAKLSVKLPSGRAKGNMIGPYLVEYNFNNQPRHKKHSNYLTRSHVSLKAVVNLLPEQSPDYWRMQAAKGGHVQSLMLLGANCNLSLLGIAADFGYTPAQTLAAKCILNNEQSSKSDLTQAKQWLLSAIESNDFVAMRELAGFYIRYSNNQSELQKAIQLAEVAGDESDDPWALEYMAAAYAKLGEFEQAVDVQEAAIKKAWDKDYNIELSEQRLAAYENSQLAIW